jgi:hypothetical protein
VRSTSSFTDTTTRVPPVGRRCPAPGCRLVGHPCHLHMRSPAPPLLRATGRLSHQRMDPTMSASTSSFESRQNCGKSAAAESARFQPTPPPPHRELAINYPTSRSPSSLQQDGRHSCEERREQREVGREKWRRSHQPSGAPSPKARKGIGGGCGHSRIVFVLTDGRGGHLSIVNCSSEQISTVSPLFTVVWALGCIHLGE